jgi:hypothetical protein
MSSKPRIIVDPPTGWLSNGDIRKEGQNKKPNKTLKGEVDITNKGFANKIR